jgi:serine/threonine protein kinase
MERLEPENSDNNPVDFKGGSKSLTDFFQPIRKLGIGSYGVVVEAQELKTKKNVAIKLFSPEAEAIENIRAEAAIF